MLNSNNGFKGNSEKNRKNNNAVDSWSKVSNYLNSNNTFGSKIPVYRVNKKPDVLELHRKQYNHSDRNKQNLRAHHLSDLPEDVKLMHMIHCHYNHSHKMPRYP